MTPDDYAEYLVDQARSSVSAFHEFRLLYVEGEKSAHLFFEGEEDVHYYSPVVRMRRPDLQVHHYVCGGKWKVAEVMESIAFDGYDGAQCVYFVDRDYDDLFGKQLPPHPRLYITNDYSIENSVAAVETLDLILTDFSRISRADPIHAEVVEVFRRGLNIFDATITPFLSWALAFREAGGKANFNNLDLKDILDVDSDGNVTKKQAACGKFAKSCLQPDHGVKSQAVRTWMRRVQTMPQDQRLRGKFKLWYFERAVVSALTKRLGKQKGDRRRVPAFLRDHHVIDSLGGRIKHPAHLDQFLEVALPAP